MKSTVLCFCGLKWLACSKFYSTFLFGNVFCFLRYLLCIAELPQPFFLFDVF